jgi:DNA mismatch repair protein MutS2
MSFSSALEKLEFEKIRQRLMRYASSDPGKEALGRIEVLRDAESVQGALDAVSEIKRLLEQEEPPPLDGIYPVQGSLRRSGAEGAVLPARELYHIGTTLRAARVLRAYAMKRRESYPRLWQAADPLLTDKVLEYNIEQAVDETGAVRTGASRELRDIRTAIADKYEYLRKRLSSILRSVTDSGFSQEEIITTREGRMVIPVKAEHKTHVPGFIHSASASGATVFVEPTETLELNNDIRSLHFREQREIERILRDLTSQIRDVREALEGNIAILASVDALQAKARYSIEILGHAPKISDRGPIKLTQARHPLLMMHHGWKDTIPLDLVLGEEFTTLVISGPNAGGKSVALKSVGLLALMVQAGLHIPAAADSVMRIFRSVYVDIGDDQSIESDLSTFSSHLVNLKQIAEQATKDSLVLIDEIGSGTDPTEGGALAAAFLEHLTRQGTYTIATTHHGALKVFAHQTPGVENGAMEFDQATLHPTYRFKSGLPGSSYALEMADRLGFPSGLMQRSREILGSDQTRLDALIAELESSAQQHRKDTEELSLQRARADAMVKQYDERMNALAAEMKEVKRKAIEEADQIVTRANATIERTVQEIREHHAAKERVSAARKEVAALKTEIEHEQRTLDPVQHSPSSPPPAVGSRVTLADRPDVGEVVALSPDGRTATVVFGVVKMRVPAHELVVTKKRGAARPTSVGLPPERLEMIPRELDLRGLTGEEALPLVDKFIDTAILAGLHRIDVIHGKGTGALRKKITEFLADHPRVQSFRLGEWNEGGTGATVVELREE